MGWLDDETGLHRRRANHVPLTPLSHLNRARAVFAHREAVVYGDRRLDYRTYHSRVSQLASALSQAGLAAGDVVSTILPNIPAQVEAHFGVPAMGAVLNTINTRLDVDTVRYIINHAAPRAMLVDTEFLPVLDAALKSTNTASPLIIEVADPVAGIRATGRHQEYEAFLATGEPETAWVMPEDEWESLSLNYTSGTTGRPKGVVCHHRGAYLMTIGTVITWRMTLFPKFLAIVPLFHCNGWNHSWMMPVVGGTLFCCRDVTAEFIYRMVATEGITHFGGAPIVLNMLANATDAERRSFSHQVEVFTAGAPPAAATLQAIETLDFNVTQVYGLTETYGHVTECIWDEDKWGHLNDEERAAIKARTGVAMPMMEQIDVFEPGTDTPIRQDGTTLGEIMIRGNAVMKGYYRDPTASDAVFATGYFATGDIAIQHPDSYIKITDRAKDIIISGGENISSVEVEGVLMAHPDVSLCAVVAKPDKKWGEVPFAFVEPVAGADPDAQTILAHCRDRLAGFKTPKGIAFQELPKTSTGKIQKFQLREQVKTL